MKRLLNILISLLGLLALGVLLLVLILTLGEQQRRTEPVSHVSQSTPRTSTPIPTGEALFESPVETPTPTSGKPFESPIETPTSQPTPTTQPTSTRWSPTPRSTPIRPGDPTPTPLPLPTPAADASGKIWFLAEGKTEQGHTQRDLYYLPLNGEGRPEREAPMPLPVSEASWSQKGMPSLYPSPSGQYLAVIEVPENGPADMITIVDVSSGETLPFYRSLGKVPTLGRFGGWHPDGRHVLYIDQENRTGLWLVDVEGKDSPQHLSEHMPDSAAISPDGQRLVFIERPILSDKSELWLAWSDGSHEKKIFDISQRSALSGLSWAPDGSKFVYLEGGASIWVVNTDGKDHRQLSRHYASGWGFPPPLWSPDGWVIAFPAQEIPVEDVAAYSGVGAFRHVNIHLIEVQTGEERRLVPDSDVGNLYPVWAPNALMVAFLSNRSGNPEIWVIDRDGSNLSQLTATDTWHSGPVWVSHKEGK